MQVTLHGFAVAELQRKAAEEVGIASFHHELPATTTQAQLLAGWRHAFGDPESSPSVYGALGGDPSGGDPMRPLVGIDAGLIGVRRTPLIGRDAIRKSLTRIGAELWLRLGKPHAAQALFEAIRPVKLANCEFERIGDKHDGGSVTPGPVAWRGTPPRCCG